MLLAYDATRYASFQVDSTGDLLLDIQNKNLRLNDANTYICSGGACPTGTVSGQGNLIVEGKIGIGTSTPNTALQVQGGSIVTNEGALTDGATITVNWQSGNQQRVTLGGNRTIAFTNLVAGQVMRLVVCQDGTGSRTITGWDASIVWQGGTAPTLTTTASKCDVISFLGTTVSGSTKAYGSAILSF